MEGTPEREALPSPFHTPLRRSPSLESIDRAPNIFSPPIRTAASPRLSQEEADDLTNPNLPYKTSYTYAFSRCYRLYDDDDTYQIPNMHDGVAGFASPVVLSSGRTTNGFSYSAMTSSATGAVTRFRNSVGYYVVDPVKLLLWNIATLIYITLNYLFVYSRSFLYWLLNTLWTIVSTPVIFTGELAQRVYNALYDFVYIRRVAIDEASNEIREYIPSQSSHMVSRLNVGDDSSENSDEDVFRSRVVTTTTTTDGRTTTTRRKTVLNSERPAPLQAMPPRPRQRTVSVNSTSTQYRSQPAASSFLSWFSWLWGGSQSDANRRLVYELRSRDVYGAKPASPFLASHNEEMEGGELFEKDSEDEGMEPLYATRGKLRESMQREIDNYNELEVDPVVKNFFVNIFQFIYWIISSPVRAVEYMRSVDSDSGYFETAYTSVFDFLKAIVSGGAYVILAVFSGLVYVLREVVKAAAEVGSWPFRLVSTVANKIIDIVEYSAVAVQNGANSAVSYFSSRSAPAVPAYVPDFDDEIQDEHIDRVLMTIHEQAQGRASRSRTASVAPPPPDGDEDYARSIHVEENRRRSARLSTPPRSTPLSRNAARNLAAFGVGAAGVGKTEAATVRRGVRGRRAAQVLNEEQFDDVYSSTSTTSASSMYAPVGGVVWAVSESLKTIAVKVIDIFVFIWLFLKQCFLAIAETIWWIAAGVAGFVYNVVYGSAAGASNAAVGTVTGLSRAASGAAGLVGAGASALASGASSLVLSSSSLLGNAATGSAGAVGSGFSSVASGVYNVLDWTGKTTMNGLSGAAGLLGAGSSEDSKGRSPWWWLLLLLPLLLLLWWIFAAAPTKETDPIGDAISAAQAMATDYYAAGEAYTKPFFWAAVSKIWNFFAGILDFLRMIIQAIGMLFVAAFEFVMGGLATLQVDRWFTRDTSVPVYVVAPEGGSPPPPPPIVMAGGDACVQCPPPPAPVIMHVPAPAPTKEQQDALVAAVAAAVFAQMSAREPAPSKPSKAEQDALIAAVTAAVVKQMDAKLEESLDKKMTASLTGQMHLIEENVKKAEEELRAKITVAAEPVDYSALNRMIALAIMKYDADKTGIPDYALENSGAQLMTTRCSETYPLATRLEKIWGIPMWYSYVSPRAVIQRSTNGLVAGECWSFTGAVGYLTIKLSRPIKVTMVSYEHISAAMAPGGNISSAPRKFRILAYKDSENNLESRVVLGQYQYDNKAEPLQFFKIEASQPYPVQFIELNVESNWGEANYTCLYRFRVHGDPIY